MWEEDTPMTLRDPLTFLLITVLIFAFSGELFKVFTTQNERDCYKANALLLEEGREGPLRGCHG